MPGQEAGAAVCVVDDVVFGAIVNERLGAVIMGETPHVIVRGLDELEAGGAEAVPGPQDHVLRINLGFAVSQLGLVGLQLHLRQLPDFSSVNVVGILTVSSVMVELAFAAVVAGKIAFALTHIIKEK